MDRTPTLTVIVPMHDVAPYLDEALASLSAQHFSDFEALLIDDGSTDGTVGIAEAHAAHDHRFRILQQEHLGLSAARNRGLDEARGEYIAFLDADDVLPDTAYERLLGTLRSSGSDFVAGAYVRLRPREDEAGAYELGEVQPWVTASNRSLIATTLTEHPEAIGNIVAWSKVSRRAFWERQRLRFPVGELYEDQVIAARFYAEAASFDLIPDVVYHWRIRAEGTSITQRERELDTLVACLTAMRRTLTTLQTAGVSAAVQARLALNLRMDLPRLLAAAADSSEQRGHVALVAVELLALAEPATLALVPEATLTQLRALASDASGSVALLTS
ncbi:glycosyltransferase [Plantibacter flavus]|uniref:glycosyltransferase family 2 protein n=1 Tax=Plantibacter flavus TaxID=150123 RepID=UPI003F17607B